MRPQMGRLRVYETGLQMSARDRRRTTALHLPRALRRHLRDAHGAIAGPTRRVLLDALDAALQPGPLRPDPDTRPVYLQLAPAERAALDAFADRHGLSREAAATALLGVAMGVNP